MKRKYLLGAIAIALTVAIGLAACGGGGGSGTKESKLPTTTPVFQDDITVHDPSIFKDDDGTYYAFGTHFSVASSKNLIEWKQLAREGNYQFLYGSGNDWRTVLADTVSAVNPGSDVTSTWAPDVIKIGKKYYMYYSLTSAFGSNKSAIGRVESNSVTGPYRNNQVLVVSNGTSPSESNAIDPNVFFDNDGRLWMVYGSAFGGIRILELNKSGSKVGLPKEEGLTGGNVGELLWSGSDDNNAEGPYIFYNKQTKYYYLMCSYGKLQESYNMRVARSKTPDGEYEDIAGNTMYSNGKGGNKLAGNYQFASDNTGYAALGHNSVIIEGGKYFVIHHTRQRIGTSNEVTPGHHLEVRQLFFTEDGWPVLNPNRYARETIGTYDISTIPGDYDIVEHISGITKEFKDSVRYTFTEDGKIKKDDAEVGTWAASGDYYIDVVLNGTTYQGVVAPAYIDYLKLSDYCITATSTDGNALWANPAKTAS